MEDQGTGSGTGAPSSSGAGSSSALGSQPQSSPSSGAGPLTSPAPGATAGSQPQPQPQQQPSGTQPPSQPRSPVPYERFDEVNTRLNSLNWAEGYEPEEVEQATQLYRWFDSDPEGAYRYLTGLLQQQGYLKNGHQQQPSNAQQSQSPLTDQQTGRPLPDIVVQETGQRLYSADQTQKLLDWAFSQVDSRVKGLEQTQATSQMVAQAQTEARSLISEAERSWPHFNEFAGDIYRELQRDGRLSLEGAYRRVVFPRIEERSRQKVIAEIRTKAAAGTGSASGPPAPATSQELQKLPLKELFKREWARRSGTG